MILYGDKDEENRPILQVAMPRAPRIYAPVEGGRSGKFALLGCDHHFLNSFEIAEVRNP
jgi:hypothetical protein